MTRDDLIEAGVITPSDGDDRTLEIGLTPFRTSGAVLRLDDLGRRLAAERVRTGRGGEIEMWSRR